LETSINYSGSITAYCNQLDEVIKEFVIKQSRLINRDRLILLQNNPRSDIADCANNAAQTTGAGLGNSVSHSPYLPDLALSDYWHWITSCKEKYSKIKNTEILNS